MTTQNQPERQHLTAVAAALLVTVLWSSSWVIIRIGMDDEALPPLTFAGLRYGLAATVLVAWILRSPAHRRATTALQRSDLARMAVLGVGFYAITQGAQFVAIDNQPAATTSVILSFTPLIVGFAGGRSLGERAARRQYAGAVLVVAGAVLYFAGDLGATTLGLIAAIVGLTANAVSSLLGRDVNRGHELPTVVVTAVSMSIGAIVLTSVGLMVDGWPSVSARAMVLIAWLAVVNTAVAFTLWNASLRHLTAIESAGLNNTMLIQIAALAWVFLDEPPGPLGIVGIVVVSVGIFLTQRATAEETT